MVKEEPTARYVWMEQMIAGIVTELAGKTVCSAMAGETTVECA